MAQNDLLHGMDDISVIADINVTPFIDIMLVLLIVFMVTAPLMLGGVHVNLPRSALAAMKRPEHPVIVSLDAANRVYVGKEEVQEKDRHTFLQRLALDSPTGEVYIRADGQVRYESIMALMAELGQAGFARVILVADRKDSAAPQQGSVAPASAQQ